jgi:CheY-like chemotaxis protein
MTKILCIEDDPDILDNVLTILEAEDYEPFGASNGREGLQAVQEVKPDLIICDISMPGVSGFEVLEALQGEPSTAIIPFIFLSAKAEKRNIREGMSHGALDYLTKPFSRLELLDAIASRLEIVERVKALISSREESVRRQMLVEIPDAFGNRLNEIMGALYLTEHENSAIGESLDSLIAQLTTFMESSPSGQFKDLQKIVIALNVTKERNIEQSQNITDGIAASGKLFSILLTLFRAIKKI